MSGARWEKDLDKFLAECDVVSINLPLSDKTKYCPEITALFLRITL